MRFEHKQKISTNTTLTMFLAHNVYNSHIVQHLGNIHIQFVMAFYTTTNSFHTGAANTLQYEYTGQ
jgi:hypothetical protein